MQFFAYKVILLIKFTFHNLGSDLFVWGLCFVFSPSLGWVNSIFLGQLRSGRSREALAPTATNLVLYFSLCVNAFWSFSKSLTPWKTCWWWPRATWAPLNVEDGVRAWGKVVHFCLQKWCGKAGTERDNSSWLVGTSDWGGIWGYVQQNHCQWQNWCWLHQGLSLVSPATQYCWFAEKK